MTLQDELEFYRTPGVFTGVGGFAREIAAIPDDVASIARAVQGLLIHEAFASAYGIALPPGRTEEKQLHGAVAMLSRAKRLDGRPIGEGRAAEDRVVCVCRHFATLFVAILRHKGTPARVRAGFANYFEAGKHTEHWVAEYWNPGEGRWILVDAQIDDVLRATPPRLQRTRCPARPLPRGGRRLARLPTRRRRRDDVWRRRDGPVGASRGLRRDLPGPGCSPENRAPAVGLVRPRQGPNGHRARAAVARPSCRSLQRRRRSRP
jgi:hypothetical protein